MMEKGGAGVEASEGLAQRLTGAAAWTSLSQNNAVGPEDGDNRKQASKHIWRTLACPVQSINEDK